MAKPTDQEMMAIETIVCCTYISQEEGMLPGGATRWIIMVNQKAEGEGGTLGKSLYFDFDVKK